VAEGLAARDNSNQSELGEPLAQGPARASTAKLGSLRIQTQQQVRIFAVEYACDLGLEIGLSKPERTEQQEVGGECRSTLENF
jgi:hypothetical protein